MSYRWTEVDDELLRKYFDELEPKQADGHEGCRDRWLLERNSRERAEQTAQYWCSEEGKSRRCICYLGAAVGISLVVALVGWLR